MCLCVCHAVSDGKLKDYEFNGQPTQENCRLAEWLATQISANIQPCPFILTGFPYYIYSRPSHLRHPIAISNPLPNDTIYSYIHMYSVDFLSFLSRMSDFCGPHILWPAPTTLASTTRSVAIVTCTLVVMVTIMPKLQCKHIVHLTWSTYTVLLTYKCDGRAHSLLL